jgi:hypothetical protein
MPCAAIATIYGSRCSNATSRSSDFKLRHYRAAELLGGKKMVNNIDEMRKLGNDTLVCFGEIVWRIGKACAAQSLRITTLCPTSYHSKSCVLTPRAVLMNWRGRLMFRLLAARMTKPAGCTPTTTSSCDRVPRRDALLMCERPPADSRRSFGYW